MELPPIIFAVLVLAWFMIPTIIITVLTGRYETRKYKREYKKRTGKDYDEVVAEYFRRNSRVNPREKKATSS